MSAKHRLFGNRLIGISGLVLGMVCTTGLSAADAVLLRYQFQPGQVVRYEVDLKDDYRIQVQSADDQQHSYVKSQKSYRVKSVLPDGSGVLELVPMEWVAVDIFQNGQVFKYDSRKDGQQENPIFAAMERMVGRATLELTMSPTGEVSNLKPILNPNTRPEEISVHAIDALIKLPQEPQTVGSRWVEKIEASVKLTNSELNRPVKIQREFLLQDLQVPPGGSVIATISVKTRVLTPISDPDEELQLIRRSPQGTIVLDLGTGQLISQTMTQESEVTGFGDTQSIMKFRQQLSEKLVTTSGSPVDTNAAAAPAESPR